MSGSETGLIASRDAYGVGLQKSPFPSQPTIQNMLLGFNPDGTAVYKTSPPTPSQTSPSYNHNSASDGPTACGGPVGPQHGCGVDMNMSGEPMKRRRGRPRKYAPDGNMALALSHVSVAVAGGTMSSPPPLHVSASAAVPSQQSGGPTSPSSFKKVRGRPPGSKSKQKIEGSTGLGFTPHVITVKSGEDVSSKIMSFSQHGPRAVCILSANGAVSNVTLRQPASSGGTVTYEGRFEILSLSGSFMLLDSGGQRSRTGGLSVSLAGPDGRVLGGCVAGLLTAAAPVQVVVGSFISEGCKEPPKSAPNHGELLSATPRSCAPAGTSPPSHGTFSDTSGGNSPHQVNHHQPLGSYNNNNNPNGMLSMPWN